MRIYNGDIVSREDVSLPDSAAMLQAPSAHTYVIEFPWREGQIRSSLLIWNKHASLFPRGRYCRCMYLLSTLFVTRFRSILSAHRLSNLVNATLRKHPRRILNPFLFLLINFDKWIDILYFDTLLMLLVFLYIIINFHYTFWIFSLLSTKIQKIELIIYEGLHSKSIGRRM